METIWKTYGTQYGKAMEQNRRPTVTCPITQMLAQQYWKLLKHMENDSNHDLENTLDA